MWSPKELSIKLSDLSPTIKTSLLSPQDNYDQGTTESPKRRNIKMVAPGAAQRNPGRESVTLAEAETSRPNPVSSPIVSSAKIVKSRS